ncbi:hypothetical protein AKJ16_DCAP03449 [Drosera capensis]
MAQFDAVFGRCGYLRDFRSPLRFYSGTNRGPTRSHLPSLSQALSTTRTNRRQFIPSQSLIPFHPDSHSHIPISPPADDANRSISLMPLLSLIAGFLAGALAVLAVEALGFLYLLRCLTASKEEPSRRGASDHVDRRDCSSASAVYQKQGAVWILEPENIPKVSPIGERNKKKDILEVSPVRKFAKIKDQSLILTGPGGSRAVVLLKGCKVVAVSATSLPSKKWAKRYPIRVESKTTELYNESNLIYIYLETSSEKES